MKKILQYLLTISIIVSCVATKNQNSSEFVGNLYNSKIKLDTLTWLDSARNRKIPVAIYTSKIPKEKQEIVIFSHGYGANNINDGYKNYSYLTKALAANNYYVISIQHELPTDELLAMNGVLKETRRPSWERGAENIMFVINELKKQNPSLDFTHITLIGHSQGGDMTALFPEKYPNIVDKIITLDNRRMALPRTSKPKVYSLRASEFAADEGVIPTIDEQKKFNIKIITLNDKHSDMGGNQGSIYQKKEIINYVLSFLKEK